MRYLAIDWGDRRTGLAMGDDLLRIASPVETIDTRHVDQRLQQLDKAIDKHGPDALVLGLPLNMDGSDGPAAKKMRDVAKTLEARTGLAVHLFDERLTSAAADGQMARTGLTHGQKKSRRDALAAAALLQDFLNARTDV